MFSILYVHEECVGGRPVVDEGTVEPIVKYELTLDPGQKTRRAGVGGQVLGSKRYPRSDIIVNINAACSRNNVARLMATADPPALGVVPDSHVIRIGRKPPLNAGLLIRYRNAGQKAASEWVRGIGRRKLHR